MANDRKLLAFLLCAASLIGAATFYAAAIRLAVWASKDEGRLPKPDRIAILVLMLAGSACLAIFVPLLITLLTS